MFCVDAIVECACFVKFVEEWIFLFHVFVQNVGNPLALVLLWIQTHLCFSEASISSLCISGAGKNRRDVFYIQRHLYILNQTTSRTTAFDFLVARLLEKHTQKLVQLDPFLLFLQTFLDSALQSQRIASRNGVIVEALYFLVELVKVFAAKR